MVFESADRNNSNVLHLAATIKNPELMQLLLEYVDSSAHSATDFFGRSPLQVAIGEKNDDIIELLGGKLDVIKQGPDYGRPLIEIRQRKLIDKSTALLKFNGGSFEVPAGENRGHCSGFQNVAGIYAARKMLDDYFTICELLSEWDENLLSLNDQESVKKLTDLYPNFGTLLHQFINDFVFFQQKEHVTKAMGLDRERRFSDLYNLVKSPFHPNIELFFDQDFPGELGVFYNAENYQYTPEQLKECIDIYSKVPKISQVKISVPRHATRLIFNRDLNTGATLNIEYYESNGFYRFAPFSDYQRLVTCIQRKTLMSFGLDINLMCLGLLAYTVDNEISQKFSAFNYFGSDALPSSEASYQAFVKSSSNKYTPLHIVVLSDSLDEFRKLIKLLFVDIHQKDVRGDSALDWIIGQNRLPFLKTLVETVSHQVFCSTIAPIIVQDDCELLEYALKCRQSSLDLKLPSDTLLTYALKNERMTVANWLIDQDALIETPDSNGNLPIFLQVVDSESNVFSRLLNKIKDANLKNQKGMGLLHYVLFELIDEEKSWFVSLGHRKEILDMLLTHPKIDIDLKDKNGMTSLAHMAKLEEWDYCEKLLNHGANVNLVDPAYRKHSKLLELLEKCTKLSDKGVMTIFSNNSSGDGEIQVGDSMPLTQFKG